MFGGLGGEFPVSLGGGSELAAIVHSELLHGYGSAFAQQPNTALWVRCYADTMTLLSGRCASACGLSQHDPSSASDQLPIWERMLDLRPEEHALVTRQQRASAHLGLLGQDDTLRDIERALQQALGESLLSVALVPLADAHITVPSNDYPWSGHVLPDSWTSTAAHLLVKLQELPHISLAEFQQKLSEMQDVLNRRINVWMTYDWYLNEEFILDEDNLDVSLLSAD